MSRYQLTAAALVAGAGYASASAAFALASCDANGPLSCHNTTAVDTCCTIYPGGQILQTQFWDTDPVTGPDDSWTIHGLWPDNCDGTYESNCDSSREYTNISAILEAQAPDTLSYMQTYWKDYSGDDESFWEHEFGKHGTCISTLDADCYDDYQPTEEVGDFFTQTVAIFKTLPSYEWLSDAGIVPSDSATYTLAEIQKALSAQHGADVVINCDGNSLNELWYQFNVQGPVQSGKFQAADPVGSGSTCPDTGIKYVPKNGGGGGGSPTPTTTSSTTSGPTPTATGAFSGKGYLNVVVDGSQSGSLISGGTWYSSGTPATYTATESGKGFTLKTSKGSCGVVDDALTCASGTEAGVFTADGENLAYDGSSDFYAESVPAGTTQGTVYTTAKDVSIKLVWEQQ